jgi:hypothetical protein
MSRGWQLNAILARDSYVRGIYRGVFPLNDLPEQCSTLPAAFIVNTAKSKQKGEHWVAIFIDAWSVGTYFDSFGLPPLHPIFIDFLNRHTVKWLHSERPVQSLLSNACGEFCVYFIRCKCRGQSLPYLLRIFDIIRPENNDSLIFTWARSLHYL